MPKALERELKRSAHKLGRAGKLRKKGGMSLKEAENAYVYGTLRKTGWKPSREKR